MIVVVEVTEQQTGKERKRGAHHPLAPGRGARDRASTLRAKLLVFGQDQGKSSQWEPSNSLGMWAGGLSGSI